LGKFRPAPLFATPGHWHRRSVGAVCPGTRSSAPAHTESPRTSLTSQSHKLFEMTNGVVAPKKSTCRKNGRGKTKPRPSNKNKGGVWFGSCNWLKQTSTRFPITVHRVSRRPPDICAAYTARPTICRTAARCPRAGPPHRGTAEPSAPRLPRYVDTNAAVSEDMLRTKHCNPIEHRATELVVMCLAAAAAPLSTERACGAVS
jgi:hypothetical protein